jgi:hypothetical protein
MQAGNDCPRQLKICVCEMSVFFFFWCVLLFPCICLSCWIYGELDDIDIVLYVIYIYMHTFMPVRCIYERIYSMILCVFVCVCVCVCVFN